MTGPGPAAYSVPSFTFTATHSAVYHVAAGASADPLAPATAPDKKGIHP